MLAEHRSVPAIKRQQLHSFRLPRWLWNPTPAIVTPLACKVMAFSNATRPSALLLRRIIGLHNSAEALARLPASLIYSRNIYFIWLGKRQPSPAKVA